MVRTRAMRRVLDAWAILAWMNGEEPVAGKVQALLQDTETGRLELSMNMINAGEINWIGS